jgi:hypothetical protein
MTPIRFPTAAEGIARERDLLASAKPAILLWQAQQASIVVPEFWLRTPAVQDAHAELVAAGWPVLARPSGGGAVPQGPATLNLAVVAPIASGFRIEDGYELICGMLAEALTRFEIDAVTGAVEGAFCDGSWNVTVGNRKLAGTAQRWSVRSGARTALMHAAVQLAPLPVSAWHALDIIHRAAGQTRASVSEAHVTLDALLPGTMRVSGFAGALARAAEDRLSRALLHKSGDGQTSPFPGQTYPATFVTGMPSAV